MIWFERVTSGSLGAHLGIVCAVLAAVEARGERQGAPGEEAADEASYQHFIY